MNGITSPEETSPPMRRSAISPLYALLALSACELEAEDTAPELQVNVSETSADALSTPIFHVDVGVPIDGATGSRWIENYRRATGDEAVSYTIPSANLQRALDAPGSVGISLQYGMDDAGGLRIVPSAVDSTGRILTDTAAPADARRFIGRYKGTVKSHFFGRNTFTRLLDEGRCEAVRATLALDDARAPQLILSDAADKEPRVYEDESRPCPPYCPKPEGL